MEDVQTKTGVDADSNHHLLMVRMELELIKHQTPSKFQALRDLPKEEETNMENNWKGIKQQTTSTIQVLDFNKHQDQE
ncbi:unnamed protein product [Schistosoma curassoni]|uniref:Ovule protein n=1 Tax=Schistosoma curassoni TaxID=6186 RepID=A0A183KEU4_9TREM|nr:unnamed protein product [Schistosoma curassoni]